MVFLLFIEHIKYVKWRSDIIQNVFLRYHFIFTILFNYNIREIVLKIFFEKKFEKK